MFKYIFVAILFAPSLLFAQSKFGTGSKKIAPIDKLYCRSHFDIHQKIGTEENSVQDFARDFIKLSSENTLRLSQKVESPAGIHFLFEQYYNGIKVYRGQVKVNLDKQGNVLSVFDNSFAISNVSEDFPETEIMQNRLNQTYPDSKHLLKADKEKVYFFDGNTFIPAVRLEITSTYGNYYEAILNNSGAIIYYKDLNRYYNALNLDTPATARVFNPDPLTTAGVVYGTPYEDANDADIAQLNDERQQVTIDVDYQGGQFVLSSPHCLISEFSYPDVQPASKTAPDFDFTRSESGFEDVNAFYHINYFQNYVELLGFNNLANYQILVDCHALNGADNSNFSASPSPRLSFGEGGVDDAEDADVITHEYGHAISNSACPGTNSGTERQALDEALGDYLASSYSRYLNDYNWQNVFSWDGHNEFWPGRLSVSSDHYPEDLVYNLYSDADIWSATLMQIWGDIGREITDADQFQALYSYSANMSMTDAAYLYLQADQLLYGGSHFTPIRDRMVTRGLLPADVGLNEVSAKNSFHLLNSAGFANGNSDAIIELPNITKAEIAVYDLSGKLIFGEKSSAIKQIKIAPQNFKTGLYLLTIHQDGENKTFKLSKF